MRASDDSMIHWRQPLRIVNWFFRPVSEVISMRIRRETTRVFPALLLEPDQENAAELASLLGSAGFEIVISNSTASALQALRKTFFFALIVVADLTVQDCLMKRQRFGYERRGPG